MSTDNNTVWNNNLVQFARLLAEINATQEIDRDALLESMDIRPSELDELFDRAHDVWEKAKDDRISKVF